MKLNDVSVAERIVLEGYFDDFRYHTASQTWYTWQGKVWESDTILGKRHRAVTDFLRTVPSMFDDYTNKMAAERYVNKKLSSGGISGILSCLQWQPGVSFNAFDDHPYELNLSNGLVDLRTCELKEHNRERIIKDYIDIEFDPDLDGFTERLIHSRWWNFLCESIRKEELTYVSRMIGYSITGIDEEQSVFFITSEGESGKSITLKAIAHALGPYAITMNWETIAETSANSGGAREDLRRCIGKRFIKMSEIPANGRMSDSMFKRISGGDDMVARGLFERTSDEFRWFGKLWIACNDMPRLKSTQHALMRRVKVIEYPFTVEKVDKSLESVLKAEAPIVLQFCIMYAREYLQHGPGLLPEQTSKAIAAYRDDQDIIGQWLEERCRVGGEGFTSSTELHESFKDWAIKTDEGRISQRRFVQMLKHRRCKEYSWRRTSGARGFDGIRVKSFMERS